MAKLNGSAKWLGLALAIVGTVVTLTLAFADKASTEDVKAIRLRVNSTSERITAVERDVTGQEKRLERIEDKIDKLLERGK